MKRVLLYILLAVTVGVFAQQQINDAAEAGSETEQPASAARDSASEALEDQGQVEAGNSESEPLEDPGKAEPGAGENELREEPGEIETDDSDFRPSEEISEDFPVPLPSDI